MNSEKENRDRKLQVPDAARVPKAEPLHPSWERAPQVAEGIARRAEALMKEVAERIRHGDTSDLPKLEQPAIGVTVRGQAAATCNHWLPRNRFKWFRTKAPSTDAIRIRPLEPEPELDPFFDPPPDPSAPPRSPAVTPIDALRDEFCSPLSTVVGAHLDGLTGAEFARDKLWTDLDDGDSPNQLPEIEFSVRTTRPGSVVAPQRHAGA